MEAKARMETKARMHTRTRSLTTSIAVTTVLVTFLVVTPFARADVGADAANRGDAMGTNPSDVVVGAADAGAEAARAGTLAAGFHGEVTMPGPVGASTSDVTLPLEPPVGAAETQPVGTEPATGEAGTGASPATTAESPAGPTDSGAPQGSSVAGAPTQASPSAPPAPVPAGGSILTDSVARDAAVEAALRTFLGSPTGMTVTLVADDDRRSGSYKEISLRLVNSKVRGLSIASLWIRLANCAVSLAKLAASGTLQFTNPGKADLVGVVAESSMNAALAANARALRMERPSLDFEPGFLRFRGRMNVPLFHRDVDVKGTLEISGGTKVMFRPRWMYVDSAKLPGFVMRALADKINPLADFSVFRFDVTLAALETTDDALLAATEDMRPEMERLRVLGLSAGAGTIEPLPAVTQ